MIVRVSLPEFAECNTSMSRFTEAALGPVAFKPLAFPDPRPSSVRIVRIGIPRDALLIGKQARATVPNPEIISWRYNPEDHSFVRRSNPRVSRHWPSTAPDIVV